MLLRRAVERLKNLEGKYPNLKNSWCKIFLCDFNIFSQKLVGAIVAPAIVITTALIEAI